MNLSKGNRIITVTIMVVLFFLMIVCIVAEAVLQQMSLDVASANPELESMRIPVLTMGLGLIALFVYTELNVGGSITQIYVLFGAIVFLMAGLVFRLLANMISDASRFKQEVDWTV